MTTKTKIAPVKAASVSNEVPPTPVKGSSIGGPGHGPGHGPGVPPQPAGQLRTTPVNPELIAELEKKLDAASGALAGKKYAFKATRSQAEGLLALIAKTQWKGIEAYALIKAHELVSEQLAAIGDAQVGEMALEEADLGLVFQFVRMSSGAGVAEAKDFVSIGDMIAVPMQELNKLRQEAKDCALELEAAQKGVTVQQLIQMYENANSGK